MKQSGPDEGPNKLETCLRGAEPFIKYNKRKTFKGQKKTIKKKTNFPD